MWKPALSVAWYRPRRSTTNALCCGTTTAVLNRTNRISRATRIRTTTVASTGTSLRSDVEFQAVHGHDAAALARRHSPLARRCARSTPRRALRPSRALRPRARFAGSAASPTSESTTWPVSRACSRARSGCRKSRNATSATIGKTSHCAHAGSSSPATLQQADHHRADAEEDDEEAARRRQLDGREHQAQCDPHPAGHGGSS